MNTEPEAFAVDLSNDGIFLWHRKPARKWEFLGSVPLNSGNLRQQLEKLKTTASAINAPSYDAIVRIPMAEVQTLTVAHDPDADTSWEIRIISAIEAVAGMSIRTIAFDIDRGDGTSDISIAWTPMAVIKQAKTFVHLIGFTPTRYTTDVNASDFPRNPNFQIVDDQAPPADLSPQHDAGEVENIADPAAMHAEQTAAPVEPAKPLKSDFGLVWFIALFLILALLIAAIYYWPGFQQSAKINSDFETDQPFSANTNNTHAIHFEKSKTIL